MGSSGGGEVIDQVEQIGQVSPQNFFFERAEAKRGGAALLRQPGVIGRTEAVARQFAAKPGDPLRRQIVAQKLDGVGVGQIQLGIGIEACEPGAPVPVLEHAEQFHQLSDRDVGMIFHRLPEVFCRIVGGAVKLDAFLNGIPV